MKYKEHIRLGICIMLCILLNVGGRAVAGYGNLPLWLDAFGTVLSAYLYGPVCGAIVGGAGNIIWSVFYPTSLLYALTNAAIGLVAGFAAKRKYFDTVFGSTSIGALIALCSVAISTPLNLMIYDGATGNMWGDGVVGYLRERSVDPVFCAVAGEFYIDFLDKIFTLFALYLLIRLVRALRGKKPPEPPKASSEKEKIVGAGLMLVLVATMLSALAVPAYAEEVPATPETAAVAESGLVASEYNTYIQTRYSSDNGLPCGTANDIAQTTNGVLWIGTYAGLYRYNGSEFRWMGEYESVRNVNCLFEDEEGRLWIGTNDNGLSILINEKIANVIDESEGLPSNSVRAIAESSDGDYYIGTTGNMQVMTLSGGLKTLNIIPDIVYACSIATDDEGRAAVVTSAGELFLLKNRIITDKIMPASDEEIYTACSFDANGALYVGTSGNKIEIYDVSADELDPVEERACGELASLNRLYFNEDGRLFVCADNGAGYFDRDDVFMTINTGKFNNSIDAMTIDYQGDLWFVSSRLGLLRLCRSAFTGLYSKIGMEEKVVNSVTYWQNRFYVGTDTGLDMMDARLEHQLTDALTESLAGVRIRCVRADSNDHLWICTYGKGLLEVDEEQNVKVYNSSDGSFGERARVVLELSDGTIAAAGDTGISLIRDGQVEKTFRYGEMLSNTMILTLTELPDHSLLAGTDGDGMVVIKDGEIVSKLTREDGLSSGVILRTVSDTAAGGDGVFIVTSNGLCYMDAHRQITTLDNFPYFNNYDIWPGSGNSLFVLGSAGIYVVNRDDLLAGKQDLEYELLNDKSGLTSALTANSWNYCDEVGNLYLSCDSGVFRMNLTRYTSTNRSYRMLVSSIKMDGVPYIPERGEALPVGRDVTRIEIYPEVINYTIDDPYVRYYLEGFDEEPTILRQNELTSVVYTNLPKGEYTFHMAVLDSKKTNVLEETSYTLIKEKAIYDNQWFHVYMLVVIMLAVSWFTWFIARTQIQRTLNFQRKELAFAREQVRMGNETILAIAKTVDAKDVLTSQHSVRVSQYSVMIAKKLGFSDEECENLRKAALLHDIGKIGIADSVLNKPGRLTDEEYAVMKSHVTKGAEILKDFTLVDHVIDGALYHHERYDGTGYAHGLKGEEIPLYGRIIGVADAFDAMTANRVYRTRFSMDHVLEELKRCRGTQFDPKIDDILLGLIHDGEIDVDALYPNPPESKEVPDAKES